MEEYIYFAILVLCLLMGLVALYKPVVGLLALLMALTVIAPQITTLMNDPYYMTFSIVVIISCAVCFIVGYTKQ